MLTRSRLLQEKIDLSWSLICLTVVWIQILQMKMESKCSDVPSKVIYSFSVERRYILLFLGQTTTTSQGYSLKGVETFVIALLVAGLRRTRSLMRR